MPYFAIMTVTQQDKDHSLKISELRRDLGYIT
jgi:hypothetical protein